MTRGELRRLLTRLDGRGYKTYKELQGKTIDFEDLRLVVEHVQGDPYAAPSRLRAFVPLQLAALPEKALSTPTRRRACRDFLVRAFATAVRSHRELAIDVGGQTVLDRSACLLHEGELELRFTVELPARGRRILGRRAAEILCELLPPALERACTAEALDLQALELHCAAVEDQAALRAALEAEGLVAFVADGAFLPRRSGIDDRPLAGGVPFHAPRALCRTLTAPNAGPVSGMAVPRGITLIVGGGFHGKSTLLRALEVGIWDHIPGDGREQVVTESSAVKIRAEDGRAVSGVDISAFIDGLPGGQGTRSFCTDLASGSTSQAATLVEALECGARSILVDEDTSASNFMIRDRRMQALVAREAEPITPLVDRIRDLRDGLGVSTLLVMGGSGDYFDHADTVIQMEAFQARDVTPEARRIAAELGTGRQTEARDALTAATPRRLEPRSITPERKPGRRKIQARRCDTLVIGRDEVEVRALSQLEHASQLRAIGWILALLAARREPEIEPIPLIEEALRDLELGHWELLNGRPDGDLALPRLYEVMAALNRLRGVALG